MNFYYEERQPPELADHQDMAEDVRERSQHICDAKDAWFEQGWDDFRVDQDIEAIAARLPQGHPALVQAYREGWEFARQDEVRDAQATPAA